MAFNLELFRLNLYAKSKDGAKPTFENLFEVVCKTEVLLAATMRIGRNKGSETSGVDKVRLSSIKDVSAFVEQLAKELRDGTFKPLPVRQVMIKKPKGGLRPLGIPSIKDRVVQEAVRSVIEPIFEGIFIDYSYGFRPGRNTHQAAELIRVMGSNSTKMWYAVEGDIKSYFSTVNHSILLNLLRNKINDQKLISLIRKMLKAGLMNRKLFQRTDKGVPQGGILSPLLANIYLHEMDRHFSDNLHNQSMSQRRRKRELGIGNSIYIRYADDFIILTNGGIKTAKELKNQCTEILRGLKLELSEEKTRISSLNKRGYNFLGFHFQRERSQSGHAVKVKIPNEKWRKYNGKVQEIFSKIHTNRDIVLGIQAYNRLCVGWGNYYKYCNSFRAKSSSYDSKAFMACVHFIAFKKKLSIKEVLKRYSVDNTIEFKGVRMKKLSKVYKGNFKGTYLPKSSLHGKYEDIFNGADSYWNGINKRGTDWGTIRKQVLERDNYTCQKCGCDLGSNFSHIHHKKPVKAYVRKDNAHKLNNLIALCIPCHLTYHSKKS